VLPTLVRRCVIYRPRDLGGPGPLGAKAQGGGGGGGGGGEEREREREEKCTYSNIMGFQ